MLKKDLWLPHEPRFAFPVFKGVNSLVSFSIRPDFEPLNVKKLHIIFGYSVIRVGRGSISKTILELWKNICEYTPLIFSKNKTLSFRLAIISRKGKFLGSKNIDGKYSAGGSVDVNVSNVLKEIGLPNDDYTAILIMTRGRTDVFRSSPGSYSMTYYNDHVYTTFRTGGFARILNESGRKSHHGFRGINPKIVVTDKITSSILLINHSSDPLYDDSAKPESVLIRPDGEKRYAKFGEIPPFGGVEKTMEELFGDDVSQFLSKFGGKGTIVTTCEGVTLGSIHLRRARDGSSMSIEHSRPSHTYLLHGGD